MKFVQSLSADSADGHGTGKPVLLPLLKQLYLPSDGKETINQTKSSKQKNSKSKETDSGSNVNKKEVRCDSRSESEENCTTNAKKMRRVLQES